MAVTGYACKQKLRTHVFQHGWNSASGIGGSVKAWSPSGRDLGRQQGPLQKNKNSSGDEIANVNFYAVRPECTRIR